MKQFIKKLLGIDKIEAETAEAFKAKLEAEQAAAAALKEAEDAKEEARKAKLSPKEIATEKKEPYVAVVETHVNEKNPRNGFFDLDWNEFFIMQLKEAGYQGDTEEEIIDKWFTALCNDLGKENNIDMARRSSGFIDVNKLSDGKSELS